MTISLIMGLVFVGLWSQEPGELIFTPEHGWEERAPAEKGTFDYDFYRARDLYDKGNFRSALNIFRRLARRTKEPTEAARALFWQGESLLAMGRPTKALDLHKKIAREYPGVISQAEMEAQEYRIALSLARGKERRRLVRPFYSPRKKGLVMLEEMAGRGPSAPFGDDAQMALLEYYIDKEEPLEAELAFEKLKEVYPGSELMPLARFQKINLLLQELRGPAYDISLLNQAESEAQRLSRDPRGRAFAQKIEQMLKDISEIRAERDYQTAQFYLRRGKLEAARIYLEKVLNEAPGTSWADRAQTQLQVIERP
ncbi:MAG: hypothetical protein AMS15_07120 [Planctomycetes bacterium DG_23]|nr:MAG: hypothetical protein AMS15_07120 [Planctomycetes bacterium DG_23]